MRPEVGQMSQSTNPDLQTMYELLQKELHRQLRNSLMRPFAAEFVVCLRAITLYNESTPASVLSLDPSATHRLVRCTAIAISGTATAFDGDSAEETRAELLCEYLRSLLAWPPGGTVHPHGAHVYWDAFDAILGLAELATDPPLVGTIVLPAYFALFLLRCGYAGTYPAISERILGHVVKRVTSAESFWRSDRDTRVALMTDVQHAVEAFAILHHGQPDHFPDTYLAGWHQHVCEGE